MKFFLGQLGRLQRRALDGDSDKIRRNCIIAADMIVADLVLAGAIDEAEADELMRGWVETYSREMLLRASIPDRLQALWRQGDVADFIPREERMQMIDEASQLVAYSLM